MTPHNSNPLNLTGSPPDTHIDPAGPSLVVLMGIAGVGKSTWARKRYNGEQLCSPDAMRKLVSDSEFHQGASTQAGHMVQEQARMRIELGKRAVIDGAHVSNTQRLVWLKFARELNVPTLLVWFDIGIEESLERQSKREERQVPRDILERQSREMGLRVEQRLLGEGWGAILHVKPEHEAGQAAVVRAYVPKVYQVLPCGGARIVSKAGYDIIGDVHGCRRELDALLEKLGWESDGPDSYQPCEPGRVVVFVGDLTDRGPDSVGVLRLVTTMWKKGRAYLVRGNHDDKLMRYFKGNNIKIDDHLQTTVDECEALEDADRVALIHQSLELLEQAPHWALIGLSDRSFCGTMAEVVVAHAAWKPSLMMSRQDKVTWFCLYGPSSGKLDSHGYPERLDWRTRYPAQAPRCITGHTPFSGEPQWHGRTLCLDTACVFGERLTAWKWPEQQLVSTPAMHSYSEHPLGIARYPVLHPYPIQSHDMSTGTS
jgi:protein phosphatase